MANGAIPRDGILERLGTAANVFGNTLTQPSRNKEQAIAQKQLENNKMRMANAMDKIKFIALTTTDNEAANKQVNQLFLDDKNFPEFTGGNKDFSKILSGFRKKGELPTREDVLKRPRPTTGTTVKTETAGGETITRKGPKSSSGTVNTPAFFQSEFGFTPEKAQEAAEIARGVRPKTLENFSVLDLTRIGDTLQLTGSPSGFQTAQKILKMANEKAEEQLKQVEQKQAEAKKAVEKAKPLTKEEASAILEEAGGDKVRAREIAKERGFEF